MYSQDQSRNHSFSLHYGHLPLENEADPEVSSSVLVAPGGALGAHNRSNILSSQSPNSNLTQSLNGHDRSDDQGLRMRSLQGGGGSGGGVELDAFVRGPRAEEQDDIETSRFNCQNEREGSGYQARGTAGSLRY